MNVYISSLTYAYFHPPNAFDFDILPCGVPSIINLKLMFCHRLTRHGNLAPDSPSLTPPLPSQQDGGENGQKGKLVG